MAIYFTLILLTIYQQFRLNPALIRITGILIDVQALLLGTLVFILAVLLETNAFEFNAVFISVEISPPYRSFPIWRDEG